MSEFLPSSQDVRIEEFDFTVEPYSFFSGHIVHLVNSAYVYICDQTSNLAMSNLAIAMPSKYDKYPVSTVLVNDSLEDCSNIIASALSKRLNIQVFCSCSISQDADVLLPFVVNELLAIMKNAGRM